MAAPILATKLYIPSPRPKVVLRPRLIERLNEALHRTSGVTLISAPAGFGKTTLVSNWIYDLGLTIDDLQAETASQEKIVNPRPSDGQSTIVNRVAWLSLDEGDNDPARFLAYLIAALQSIAPNIGEGVLGILQLPQPPPIESILTALLNEITTIPEDFALVLDDYHLIDAKPVENALTFLIEHQPPQMHMVIATREDPNLPLARLRASGQLTELRAADLRFTLSEAADFLNQVMGLNLSTEDIAALETRTEGWIAGLQLAALSMQGHQDAATFIQSFTGSHYFVMDYLVEEVLQQQSESVQSFLLRTSILDRMCGPLCDAVLLDSSTSGQETLEHLEHANLFIVPLDNERHWYRYHHLFADLLRQRLHQSVSDTGNEGRSVNELHIRASQWYEDNDLDIEAFHHAVDANDVARATRLVEGAGMPLHFRGAAVPVLNWLESLPPAVLDTRPSLWVIYASALLFVSQINGVEQKLQAAEAALQGVELDETTRDLVGHIASVRATLAAIHHDIESIIAQSRRALEYLHPNNLPVRTATTWTLGYAYHLQGDRTAASRAYTEAISISQAIGHFIINLLATIGLGNIQESENQLYLAVETYQRVLQLAGDPPLPVSCEARLGLARIFYEWNDLEAAEHHGQRSVELVRQIENVDNLIACEVFLARLKLAQGDVSGAASILGKAEQFVHQHNFVFRISEVAAAQVLMLLRQGNLSAAAHLAQTHELPISQARVHLAQGDTSAALAVLEPWRQQVEAKGWADEKLKVMVLQAVALKEHGEKERAVQLLVDALALAEPSGFIRLFVDEGPVMAQLLSGAAARRMMRDYIGKLLAAFKAEEQKREDKSYLPAAKPLIDPLSQRELEVLRLIAQGLSNDEISKQLFLALDTVKGHNRRIYDKLQVQRRTEAVARARELGLL
ncbi:MAG: LuxR C-terminal-related transcriptional regulator [Anaerolineae bacterium]|nr:LuxR C-terminal-related transcriptional regulator [Anaerolineae bacterium]